MKMDRWLIFENSDSCAIPKNLVKSIDKLDKIKLSVKAQQKLFELIKSNSEYLKIQEANLIEVIQIENKIILLPNLTYKSFNKTRNTKNLLKWSIQNNENNSNNDKKIQIFEQKLIREPFVLSKSCKTLMNETLRKNHRTEINEIEKFITNPFFVDFGLEPVIKPIIKQSKLEKWKINNTRNNIEEILNEELSLLPFSPANEIESFNFIPTTFFDFDFSLKVNLLPISKLHNHSKNPNSLTKKWNIPKLIGWTIDNLIINQILNEEINEFELKYKISIDPIRMTKNSNHIVKNIKSWKLSEYQETIISWKPFAKLKLQDTLNEECSNSIPITMPINVEEDKYIKLFEIRTGKARGYTLECDQVVVNLNSPEKEADDKGNEIYNNEYMGSSTNETKRFEEWVPNRDLDEIRKIASKIDGNNDYERESEMIDHNQSMESIPLFVSQYSNQSIRVSKPTSPVPYMKNEKDTIVNPQPVTTPNTSISATNKANAKRKSIEFDSLVLKKRKKSNTKPIKFDFNRKYPYLEILNQTSTLLMTYNQSNSETSSSNNNIELVFKSKEIDNFLEDNEIMHVPIPECLKNKNKNKNKGVQQKHSETNSHYNNDKPNDMILDFTESDISYSPFDIPESKMINIYMNVKFANKFGAAFFKFNDIIEADKHFNLVDFSVSEIEKQSRNNLEYDLFLNPSCGVIFLRTINIYQVDIKTGENLILKQISEIAYQVLSMIIIVIIEAGIDIETDKKLLEFIESSENYGITIYIINNNSNSIATSIIELIQEFSNFENSEFQWDSKHQFLETCGVWNPCLSNFILNNWDLKEFIMMSANERTKVLETFCSIQLIDRINQAVQAFHKET